MKLRAILTGLLLLGPNFGLAQDAGDAASRSPAIGYTLLDGSSFVDDCQICGRPTILQKLRGTFDLVLLQNTPPLIRYALINLDLTASPGFSGPVHITGGGSFQIFAEFAVLQDMELQTQVQDDFTNRPAYFTNDSRVALRPFPLIQMDLTQTNGTLLQTFHLHLVAAPLREVWFSLAKPLTATNNSTDRISAGDLISNRGRIVKFNLDLVNNLGIMPVVPDLGLDAVDVTRHGEILFSIPQDVWSETLGLLQHGDLLSDRGRIVKRNQQLLAAFGVPSSGPDVGLDAVQLMPDGEIFFSIQSNLVTGAGESLGPGDILSDSGKVFRTNKQLLANFHPAATNVDFGLDALFILPDGEIWFSVETGFADNQLGQVLAGDVLSDKGYRVFSQYQLVAAFGPQDSTADYGLDALFAVTALKPPAPRPRLFDLQLDAANNKVLLSWDGEGEAFQVERASSLMGPWESCGPIVPDLSFTADCGPTNGRQYFYRVRQW